MTADLSPEAIIAEVARGLADAADDGCFDNPPCCDEPPCSDSCSTDLDEWHSGEEDREYWTKLARAGVSRLRDAGHTIVPSGTVTEREDILSAIRKIIDTHPGGEVVIDELRGFLRAVAAAASPTAQEPACEHKRTSTEIHEAANGYDLIARCDECGVPWPISNTRRATPPAPSAQEES